MCAACVHMFALISKLFMWLNLILLQYDITISGCLPFSFGRGMNLKMGYFWDMNEDCFVLFVGQISAQRRN